MKKHDAAERDFVLRDNTTPRHNEDVLQQKEELYTAAPRLHIKDIKEVNEVDDTGDDDDEVENDSMNGEQTRCFLEKYRKENQKEQLRAMSYVKHLLGNQNKAIELHSIKDTAKLVSAALIDEKENKTKKKRIRARRGESFGSAGTSSEDEDPYFRSKGDLKFSNLEWKDIATTRLGRHIDEKMRLQKGEIKNLEHKCKQMEKTKKIELERQENQMTMAFNNNFKESLASHLEKFKSEAKRLRLQLNSYKREFQTKDLTFFKLRNACYSQEFVIMTLRRYLKEQNMRMIYRLLGEPLPKVVREKLLVEGADFSDMFPKKSNLKPGPTFYNNSLGLLIDQPPSTDEQLQVKKPQKKVQGPSMLELGSMISQQKMEIETIQEVNNGLVLENLGLKHKIVDLQNEAKDMKNFMKAIKHGNQQEVDGIKLMFLSKKTQLIKVINDLKKRLNAMNQEVDHEVGVRDLLLIREQKTTRRLRSEVMKAKDVLMSNDMVFKARNVFKNIVDLNKEDQVFLEGGNLNDLLSNEQIHRGTFQFDRALNKDHKKATDARKRCQQNQIMFKDQKTAYKSIVIPHSSEPPSSTHLEETPQQRGPKEDQNVGIQRKLMGQSVEWKRLPFDFESILTNNSPRSNAALMSKYEAHKGADVSYRRNANLYSSIMGKATSFLAMSTEPVSKANDNQMSNVTPKPTSPLINFTNAAHSSTNTMSQTNNNHRYHLNTQSMAVSQDRYMTIQRGVSRGGSPPSQQHQVSGNGVPLNVLRMQDVINRNRGQVRTSHQIKSRAPRISVSPQRMHHLDTPAGAISTHFQLSSPSPQQQSLDLAEPLHEPLQATMTESLGNTDEQIMLSNSDDPRSNKLLSHRH